MHGGSGGMWGKADGRGRGPALNLPLAGPGALLPPPLASLSFPAISWIISRTPGIRERICCLFLSCLFCSSLKHLNLHPHHEARPWDCLLCWLPPSAPPAVASETRVPVTHTAPRPTQASRSLRLWARPGSLRSQPARWDSDVPGAWEPCPA